MWLEHSRGDDIDRVAQQRLQLDVECGEIEQVGTRFEVDEEVDVTGVIVFTADHAAKDAHIAGLVCVCEGNDLIAVPGQDPAER